MITPRVSMLIALSLSLLAPPALAERDELIAGLHSGAQFPGFRAQDPTDFVLATWTAGAWAEYGLFDDLTVGGRFTYSQFDALDGDRSTVVDGFPLSGDLRFGLETWHAQLTARYTLLAGYSAAPRLHLGAGYVWQVIGDQHLDTADGSSTVEGLADEGRGAFTLTAGLMVDYRLFELDLAALLHSYAGDVRLALAAYNTGPRRVDAGRIPTATAAYVDDILNRFEALGGTL